MNFNEHFETLGVQLEHFMPDDGSGVYIKQTHIPAGVRLEMHTHTFSHKSVLASGRVWFEIEGERRELKAPLVLSVEYGNAHAVEAITDAVWMCIHATDVLDADNIDHHLVSRP